MAGNLFEIFRKRFHGVTQATAINKNIQYEEQKEATFHEGWITEQFGKIKNVMGKQIGGEMPQTGPDVLKHILKYDPKNTSGSIQPALDIMTKLQGATKSGDLMSSIQPLQNILGGGLYKSMKSAGSAAKSHEKIQEEKPQNNLLTELIAAALACAVADAELIGDLLDANEISKIENALKTGTIYTSTIMPASFVQCVNNIIPTFRAAKGLV